MSDEYMLDDVVMELRDTLGMIEHADAVTALRARLAAAESELASVKKGGAEFIHPVEELIGGPNACGICGRNDGLHYAHE